MDGFTIWQICPSCNGTKKKFIPVTDGQISQLVEVDCTDCNEKGLKLWGYAYEKSFDEIPGEPT